MQPEVPVDGLQLLVGRLVGGGGEEGQQGFFELLRGQGLVLVGLEVLSSGGLAATSHSAFVQLDGELT